MISIRTLPHLMGEISPTDSGERINLSVNEEVTLNGSTAHTVLSNSTNSPKETGFSLNLVNDKTNEREEDNVAVSEPSDENPASFFRIPSPPSFNDSWSLN